MGTEKRAAAELVRVVMVNQAPELTATLLELFRQSTELIIVGVAGSLKEGARVVDSLGPDIVLADFDRPDSSGAAGFALLRGERQQAQVIVLTGVDAPASVRAALAQGVRGYILKNASKSDFLYGIRAVVAGECHLSPRIAALVAGHRYRDRRSGPKSSIGITDRESAVLTMIAVGHCNKRMAGELNVSVKTVEKHRANVMQKLKLHNVAELTRFAIRHQFVTVEGQRRRRQAIDEPPDLSAQVSKPERWIRVDNLPFAVSGCSALACVCPYRYAIDRRSAARRQADPGASGGLHRKSNKRTPRPGRRAADEKRSSAKAALSD
jgi:DNA-binding NarL/FixJ family response regulator